MSYTVKITDTAKNDLREIAFYIADSAKNVDVALKFVGELQERCGQLVDFPNSGAFPKDHILKSSGYRFLTHKEYLICYTVDEDNETVYVSAFFNAKKDYLRVLNKLV